MRSSGNEVVWLSVSSRELSWGGPRVIPNRPPGTGWDNRGDMRCPSCGNENREGARFCDSCGSELTAEPAAAADLRQEPLAADVPAEIAGRYRVKRFLGQGGRKRVYLSDDTATGTEVAVALFDTDGGGSHDPARARREAEAMRKLGDHPHIVTVLDTGEEDGKPFIVSSYMPGGDVEGLLAAAGGRLEVSAGGRDRR